MHDLVIRGGTIVDGTGAPALRAPTSRSTAVRIAAVGAVAGAAGARSTRAACSSRPAGSTCTRTTTARSPGIRSWRRRAGTASRRWSWATAASASRRVRPRRRRLPDRADGRRRGHPRHGARTRASTGAGSPSPSTSTRSSGMPRALDVAAQVPHCALRAYVMRRARARRSSVERRRDRRDGASSRARRCAPARSASRPRARSCTARSTASCRARLDARGAARHRPRARRGRPRRLRDGLRPAGSEEPDLAWMQEFCTRRPAASAHLRASRRPPMRARTAGARLLAHGRGASRAGHAHRAAGRRARPTGHAVRARRARSIPSSFHPTLPRESRSCRSPSASRALRDPAGARAAPRRGAAAREPDRAHASPATGRRSSRSAIRPTTSPRPSRASRAIAAARPARGPRRSPTTGSSSATASSSSSRRSPTTSTTNFEALREMMLHPRTVLGLSDGGAHCGLICDASMPTFLLTHWVRDRKRGERIPLEQAVRLQTGNTAARLRLRRPRHARGRQEGRPERHRLRRAAPARAGDGLRPAREAAAASIQRVDGLPGDDRRAARSTFENGEPTGAMPGKLVRAS